MKRKYQNKQLWCECQLVTLWNAYKFLGKEPPTIGSGELLVQIEGASMELVLTSQKKEKDQELKKRILEFSRKGETHVHEQYSHNKERR